MTIFSKQAAIAERVKIDTGPIEEAINAHLTTQVTIDYLTSPDIENPQLRVNVPGTGFTQAAIAAVKEAVEAAGWKAVEVIQEAKRLVVAFAVAEKVTPPEPADVYVVTVTPSAVTVKVGATAKLTVAVTKNGAPFPGATPTFTSATPATATVAADGTITGVAEGSVVVTVKEGELYTKAVTTTVTA